MEKTRCSWCLKDDLYMKYHDEEWGYPVFDDGIFFEHLVMEASQAGLSFHTILLKRENYRKVFDDFDFFKIAEYDDKKIDYLMSYEGIIRNRKKIEAIINNANVFIKVQKEFGSFSNYIWSFTGGKQIVNHYEKLEDIPAKTELSEKVSKDMKKKGFKFIGPVSMYAFFQATGIINDHIVTCHRYKECLLKD